MVLQIATGKPFARSRRLENTLRGMLYTNAFIVRDESIETAAGRLLPSSSYSVRPFGLVFEFTERIEDEGEERPGILISSTAEPYLHDYAVLVSFGLNCICTPDFDLARRLTSGERGLSTRVALLRPYLALYALFNRYLPEHEKMPMSPSFQALVETELDVPSPEAMISFTLYEQAVSWPLQSHQGAVDTYFRQRASKNGIRFPRLFDAAITLELAERYCKAGDIDRCREVVALAVENHPGHAGLLGFEKRIDPEASIRWHDVLLPRERPDEA